MSCPFANLKDFSDSGNFYEIDVRVKGRFWEFTVKTWFGFI